MRQKILYMFLIISLLMNFNVFGKAKTSKDTPGTAIFVMAEAVPISVDTKNIVVQLPEINLNIKVPQIKGLNDKQFEKGLNKLFLTEATKAKNNALKTAKEYNKNIIDAHLTPIKFEYISTFSVIEAPRPYLVLGFLEYQYSGGAHGISYQKYLNLRTTDNKILKLQDLFKAGIDYKTIINNEVKEQIQMRQSKGEYFFPSSQGFSSIKNEQEYYINKKGDIVIVFNIYEIAPYAAGIIEFVIPREKLAHVLQ